MLMHILLAEQRLQQPVPDFAKAVPEDRPNLSQLLAPVADELVDLNNNLKSVRTLSLCFVCRFLS